MNVTILIDLDEGCWRATSEEIPSMSMFAMSVEELRELIRTGVPFYLERDDVTITEVDRSAMTIHEIEALR